MKDESYRKGKVIVREGDPGDCMFYVRRGTVGIYAAYGAPAERKLAELQSGDYFGEMSLLDGQGRSATIVSLDNDTVLNRIDEDEFSEFMAENPHKVLDIMSQLSHKLREVTKDYVELCKEIESARYDWYANNEKLVAIHDAVEAKAKA